MKRLIVILCCLSVFFGGLASAWANCKQVAITADHYRRSLVPAPVEDHHSEAQHDHSHGTVIHCATLDEFLLSSTFLVTKDHRVQRLTDPFVAALDYEFSQHVSHWLIHGPPGLARLNSIPSYILLSVLRI